MALGVHSEVGRLRRVMVHRPGLEHTRLTPSNAEELLFDDVLWVARAKQEHDTFSEVKSSTRTRSAFEVGAFDQGAHVTYLDPSGSQLGHKESIADTATRNGPPRSRAARAHPITARLSASVPPDVKITWPGSAPRASAMRRFASSTPARAARPKRWGEEGFPKASRPK